MEDFCSTEVDTTILEVYHNGIDQTFQFSLDSFVFADTPNADIFMHCEVSWVRAKYMYNN